MTKFKGTNSVALLMLRTAFHLKFSVVNFFVPIISFFASGYFFSFLNKNIIGTSTTIISTLLSMNGSILGLLASGFAIYAALPNEDITIASVTNKPEGSRFSFLKSKLLVFFKGFFWLLFCLIIMTIFYLLLTGYSNSRLSFSSENKPILTFLLFGSIGWLQAKVFVELKIMVFYMYTNALTQARLMAIKSGQTPADDSID